MPKKRRSDELLTLYLNDVGRYPLLTQAEEQSAAQRLEKCRRLYRRHMLSTDGMLFLCVKTLKKIRRREIRLESVINISPRDRSRAKEIRGRLDSVISTVERLSRIENDCCDASPKRRGQRKEAVDLIEELSLRTKTIREMWDQCCSGRDLAIEQEHIATEADEDPKQVSEAARRSIEYATRLHRRIRRVRQVERAWAAAQGRFAQHNLRLVVAIAKKYKSSRLAFLDLVQEGSLGLLMAVEKFEPRRGFKFSTYASWWIRETIQRAFETTVRRFDLQNRRESFSIE